MSSPLDFEGGIGCVEDKDSPLKQRFWRGVEGRYRFLSYIFCSTFRGTFGVVGNARRDVYRRYICEDWKPGKSGRRTSGRTQSKVHLLIQDGAI